MSDSHSFQTDLFEATEGRSVEAFVHRGRAFRWVEGVRVRTEDAGIDRSVQASHFVRTVVPAVEAQGAVGAVAAAAAPAGWAKGSVRWVHWHAPGRSADVWGLYVASACLAPSGAAPSNDDFVLVAWGETSAVRWASDGLRGREAVRAALHAPPSWMARGFRSCDVTFRVRVERMRDQGGARTVALASAVPTVASARAVARAHGDPTPPEVLAARLREWREAHPARRQAS